MVDQPQSENAAVRRPERQWNGRESYQRRYRRSLVPRANICNTNLTSEALEWFLPWHIHDYPGKIRGLSDLLGVRISSDRRQAWRNGRNGMPVWALERLLAYIRQRCATGMSLAARLEAHIAERALVGPQRYGVCAVDPVTGLDGRPARAKRRAEAALGVNAISGDTMAGGPIVHDVSNNPHHDSRADRVPLPYSTGRRAGQRPRIGEEREV
jgi:hypothetical protein